MANTKKHKKYKKLADMVADIRRGAIDETKLRVVQDNDCSHVYIEDGTEEPPCIFEGNGYYDTEELWPLVLPKATVEWC